MNETLLARVVETSQQVAATSKRTEKIGILAGLLNSIEPNEAPTVVAMLSGELRQGKIGVGYQAVLESQVDPADSPSLGILDFDQALTELGSVGGSGSQEARAERLRALLGKATVVEQEFIRQLLLGELRQGALAGVMVDAVAKASDTPKALVRRAAMLTGDLAITARMALQDGHDALSAVGLEVLRPVQPMLAKTAGSVAAALDDVGEASVEWKLDGVRIQVHRHDDQIAVYTRNLNEVSDRMPEIADMVRSLKSTSFVLDGEAILLDGGGDPQPFQQTMSRFGTEDTDAQQGELVPFFFDILSIDGRSLIDLPLSTRQTELDRLIPQLHTVPRVVTSDPDLGAGFLAEAKAKKHEGVMVKAISSTYQAGGRGASWFKVKPAHTLDLVVLAAEWGHGRRTGWLSNLHLGARRPDGGFVMLGKTFKGMTDSVLSWQTERLLELEERRTKSTVFVRPELVVEVAFDGLLPSARYPGGMALRFARIKGYRHDKKAEHADTIEMVRAIFEG